MKKFTFLIFLLGMLPYVTGYRAIARTPVCTMTATVTCSAPILCNGSSTTVTVSATGGTEPYTGVGNFTVSAGTYYYTVTDAAGCTATTSITVTQPEQLVVSECGCSRARCKGDTVQKGLTVTGGTPPYSGAGPYILTAGSYILTVTDANGCSSSISVNISEPDTLIPSVTAGTIACHGGNATVNISATGGSMPYSGTGTYTLPEGSYNYTIYDSFGCAANVHVDLTAPAYLSATATPGPTSCLAGTSVVTVTATGGTAPYSGVGTFTVSTGVHTFDVIDANGCTTSTTIYVGGPTSITANAVSGNILCNGGATTINVTGSGGAEPYTGIGTFTVTAGTYNYTITDAGGCSASTSVTVSEPPLLHINYVIGTIPCHGGSASVDISATGGTTPYSGIGTFSHGAGAHTYMVSDINGCSVSVTETITEPAELVPAISVGNILCNGGTTTVNISATGGTASYVGTGTYTVTAGSHNFTVTDANGCSVPVTANITEPAMLAAAPSVTPIACSGTAAVAISATGGNTPYSGVGTFTVTPGTYSYTVTDANGCTATTSPTVNAAPTLSANILAGTINCHGGTTTVNISATGGTAPYSGAGTHTVSAGLYNYIVTDANGCSAPVTVNVIEPAPLAVSTSASTASCAGTATVVVEASGGTSGYSGVGTYTVTPGTYTYTVTDANGCASTVSTTINPPPAVITSASAGPITCYGATTTVTVSATGGIAPFTGTGTFTVTAGTYDYTVTDAKGCAGHTSLSITQPAELTANATAGPIMCNGATTTIALTGSGGIAPYSGIGYHTVHAGTYAYTITDANGCNASASITLDEPALMTATTAAQPISCFGAATTVSVTATGGVSPYSGIGSFSANAGSHNFTVTDAHGCTSTTTITLVEPDDIRAHTASASAGCGETANKGKAWVAVSGGIAPYRYQWDATAGGVMTDTAMNLHAGTYVVTVSDNNNCSVNESVIVSGGNSSIVLDAVATNTPCYNDNKGAVELHISGGNPPYKSEWSNGANTQKLINVPAGSYSVTVTDKDGCISSTSVAVSRPDSIYASATAPVYPGGYNLSAYHTNDGSISCAIKGGVQPYTFAWSNGSNTQDLANLPAGVYTLRVTDANGCTTNAKVDLTEPIPVDLPDAISPNGDDINDTYVVRGIDNYPENNLQIFNRWGNLVYSIEKYQNTWDGRNNKGEPLPEGTYYVVLKLNSEITKAAYVEVRR